MKISRTTVLGIAPIFFVSYFTRVGESSLYIFDLFFPVVLLLFLPKLPKAHVRWVAFSLLALPLAAAPGVINGTTMGASGDWLQAAVVCARYLQFFIFSMIVVSVVSRDSGNAERFPRPTIAYGALMLPLIYGLVMLRVAPEQVLFADRLASYFGNPNALGAYICASLMPMVMIIRLFRRKSTRACALVAFLGAAVACLFFAGSMSGWITCVLAGLVAVAVFAREGRRLKVLFGGAAIAAGLAIAAVAVQPVLQGSEIKGLKRTGELIQTIRLGGEALDIGSGRLRVSLARDALDIYLSSPGTALVGVGLGQSASLIGQDYGSNITTHTAYLVILLEGGLLVSLVLLLMFRAVLKAARVDRYIWGVFSGYLLAMLSSPHIYLPFLWGATAYGLGLVVSERRARSGQRDSLARQRPPLHAVADQDIPVRGWEPL